MAVVLLRPTFLGSQLTHLVKACCKEIAGRQDATVGAQVVLLHHILVLDLQGGMR